MTVDAVDPWVTSGCHYTFLTAIEAVGAWDAPIAYRHDEFDSETRLGCALDIHRIFFALQ